MHVILEDEESPIKTKEVSNLIAEVKKYPILFDPAHQHFKNNAARTKVWDKVAESLGNQLDRKKVMVKWKNLKKKFVELERLPYKNKSTPNAMRNQSVFLEAMQFIVPFNDAKKLEESMEIVGDVKFQIPQSHHTIRPSRERDILQDISEDILIEDAFVDEIKKHPELLCSENSSHQSRSTRKKIWAELAAKFQQNGTYRLIIWDFRKVFLIPNLNFRKENDFKVEELETQIYFDGIP